MADSSLLSLKSLRPPEDAVFFTIHPDASSHTPTLIQSLHQQILSILNQLTTPYIWHHHPPTLTPHPTHLSGNLRFGDSLEDEWFLVYCLFHISQALPNVSIRVWDSDGDFLLIESAYHLPRWLDPETSPNRVFIRRGILHIIPRSIFPQTPKLEDALGFLTSSETGSPAPDKVQKHLKERMKDYPERAYKNVHWVRVRVPVNVAWVLKHEPVLVQLAIEAFYDRDVDTMKYAAKMEKFGGREMVDVAVKMSRARYAQLVQQSFRAPKGYPMPERGDSVGKYMEAELGMMIACGFEMMYQMRKRQGEDGKGGAWEVFKEVWEKVGCFDGLLPGSKEYKKVMEMVEGHYRSCLPHFKESEVLSAPSKRIDEILALPYSADDFENQDLPPSDDDSWLYGGEDELDAALGERQKEMELYNMKRKEKHKSKDDEDGSSASAQNIDGYDLGGIAKSMEAFVEKMSSYKGAEIPEDRHMRDVDFDADQFMKDIEKALGHRDFKDDDSDLAEESLDLDFDDYEEYSDHSEDMNDRGDEFMDSYTDALNKELKDTSLSKTFVRAQEQSSEKNTEGTSGANKETNEFTPVDVDFNLVKNILDSYSSQEGLSGPASNLLGLMGLRLPEDTGKGK